MVSSLGIWKTGLLLILCHPKCMNSISSTLTIRTLLSLEVLKAHSPLISVHLPPSSSWTSQQGLPVTWPPEAVLAEQPPLLPLMCFTTHTKPTLGYRFTPEVTPAWNLWGPGFDPQHNKIMPPKPQTPRKLRKNCKWTSHSLTLCTVALNLLNAAAL